jgi:hypothetical protein
MLLVELCCCRQAKQMQSYQSLLIIQTSGNDDAVQ